MVASSHHNNFNLLRLVFAVLVVYSHAYALLGLEEPIIWGRSLGNLSVHGFFVISGYLICQSYVRSQTLIAFSANRVLRILPGLIVALLVTGYIADFFGGFKENPVPYIANGPVWTLSWEVACYIMLAVLGLLGTLNRDNFSVFFAVSWLLFLLNISSESAPYLVVVPLVMMFLAGAFISLLESRINFSKMVLFSLLLLGLILKLSVAQAFYNWMASNIPFLWGPKISLEQIVRVGYMAAFPVLVIYLGKYTKPLFKLKDDISYGVYIYGWPIAQALVFVAVQRNWVLTPITYFLLTMLVLLPVAYLSWRLIEKPSMSLKKWFVGPSPLIKNGEKTS
jgi:peptidoglycan/LPS O-acetylase OafA/YrhL